MENKSDREIFAPQCFSWDSRDRFNQQSRPCEPEGRYIVDLSNTGKIDAIGIGLILQLADALGNDRKRLYLARAQGPVLEALQAVGLDRHAHFGYPECLE